MAYSNCLHIHQYLAHEPIKLFSIECIRNVFVFSCDSKAISIMCQAFSNYILVILAMKSMKLKKKKQQKNHFHIWNAIEARDTWRVARFHKRLVPRAQAACSFVKTVWNSLRKGFSGFDFSRMTKQSIWNNVVKINLHHHQHFLFRSRFRCIPGKFQNDVHWQTCNKNKHENAWKCTI